MSCKNDLYSTYLDEDEYFPELSDFENNDDNNDILCAIIKEVSPVDEPDAISNSDQEILDLIKVDNSDKDLSKTNKKQLKNTFNKISGPTLSVGSLHIDNIQLKI